jgi:predicted Zn-dependent peptidase
MPGTVVIPTDQPAMRVAVQLLEPRTEDGFVGWGFFDAIFEQKEYFEADVMEQVGERMLAADSVLNAEFRRLLAADSAFSANPRARLAWLYQRSPYADRWHNVYPVGRFSGTERLNLEPLR